MKVWQKNVILIALVVLLAAFPLWSCKDAEFGGADGIAGARIECFVLGRITARKPEESKRV